MSDLTRRYAKACDLADFRHPRRSGAFASREAGGSMLTDPSAHAPFPYREDRLGVRRMDARRLAFPDRATVAMTDSGWPVSCRQLTRMVR